MDHRIRDLFDRAAVVAAKALALELEHGRLIHAGPTWRTYGRDEEHGVVFTLFGPDGATVVHRVGGARLDLLQ